MFWDKTQNQITFMSFIIATQKKEKGFLHLRVTNCSKIMETFILLTQRPSAPYQLPTKPSSKRLPTKDWDLNNLKTRYRYSLTHRINHSLLNIVAFLSPFAFPWLLFTTQASFLFLLFFPSFIGSNGCKGFKPHLIHPVGAVSMSQSLWASLSSFNWFFCKLPHPPLDRLGNFTAFQNIIKLFNHLPAYYEKKPTKN